MVEILLLKRRACVDSNCMRVESRAARKKKLYKLIVALKDIVDARHACSLFGKTITSTGDDLYYPLLSSIAVSYSKPFIGNKALGPLSGHWRKFEKPKLQKTHDRLLKFRNDNIAHNDLDTAKVQIIPPGAKIPGQQTNTSKALQTGMNSWIRSFAKP